MLLYSCANFTAKNSHAISILISKDYLIYIYIIREAHQEKNYFYLELTKNDANFLENKWNKTLDTRCHHLCKIISTKD